MAPPWVLLDRMVSFVDGGDDTSEDQVGFDGGASEAAAALGESSWEMSPREAMEAMIPNPVLADPPKVTILDMLRQTRREQLGLGVYGGEISSTDKNLVVLYSGCYRPGNGGFSGDGCYLVYDASSNSLSAVPPLPESPTTKGLGRSAVIMSQSSSSAAGQYDLVDVVTTRDPGLPEATLWLWSSGSGDGWRQIPVLLDLPKDLYGPTRFFGIDMAFTFAGRIFWVDLLAGVLICDLAGGPRPTLSFIPYPSGYCMDIHYNHRLRLKPEEFRSVGCVCGGIKFVALDGYISASSDQVVLKTLTLSPDFKEWREERNLCIVDLWASQSFKEMDLPQIMPMCPVLSINEDGVVYVILNDVEKVVDVNEFGEYAGVELVLKANYRLGIDVVENKVMSCVKTTTDDLTSLTPTLLASEFSAYLQDPMNRQ